MSSYPSSTFGPTPDSFSSTPHSGIYSAAARTRLDYDSDKNRNSGNHSKSKLGLPKQYKIPRYSAGSLAEAAVSVKAEIRGQRSGGPGFGHLQSVGGAVRPGQAKDWEVKKTLIYGANAGDKSSQVRKEDLTRKDLEEKINSLSRKEVRGSSKFGGGDFNLNFSQPDKQETDLLDTIDLSSPSTSTCTTPPPFLEQKVIPHNIGFKVTNNCSCLAYQLVVTAQLNLN